MTKLTKKEMALTLTKAKLFSFLFPLAFYKAHIYNSKKKKIAFAFILHVTLTEAFLSLFSAHGSMVALETHSVCRELWGTANRHACWLPSITVELLATP